MTRTLIIGRGLIGSALARSLGGDALTLSGVEWWNPPQAHARLESAVRLFTSGTAPWTIAWCAGPGSVGSSYEVLQQETMYLNSVLAASAHTWGHGRLMLVSSAGGVFGGVQAMPITDQSPTIAISDYGLNKLVQEDLAQRWAARGSHSLLIVRPSNVYGPGQDMTKAQGLVSMALWKILRNEELTLTAFPSTQRDFVYVDDLARTIHRLLIAGCIGPHVVASGEAQTVQQVLDVAQRITGRTLRTRYAAADGQQPTVLTFAPTGPAVVDDPTPFEEGVKRTLAYLRGLLL